MNAHVTRKKKIKILHIITRLIQGGADENTLLTIRKINSQKFSIDLAIGKDSEFFLFQDLPKKNVIFINELKRNIDLWNDLKALIKIYKIIRKNGYDIVHTHTAKAGFLGRIAAYFARTPVIIHTLHGITFHRMLVAPLRNFYIFLEKLAGNYTNVFITVGEDLKRKYIEQNIGIPENYVTIHSGFDLKKFIDSGELSDQEIISERRNFGISEKDRVIGTVSRLEPRKGHIYLFDALEQIVKKNPAVKLLVVGNGAYEAELKRKVLEKQLSNHVIFLGFRKDIVKVMRLFDVFTLTSLWEGLPRVLVQAALLELPIVTFDVEGAWEVVNDGVNGFIVPSENIDLLTKRLNFFIENPDIAKRMGKNGSSIIVKNSWDAEVMVEKIIQVYEKMLSSVNHIQSNF